MSVQADLELCSFAAHGGAAADTKAGGGSAMTKRSDENADDDVEEVHVPNPKTQHLRQHWTA